MRERSRLVVVMACLLVFLVRGASQESLWQSYISAGDKAIQEQNYAAAEVLFLAALKQAKKLKGDQNRQYETLRRLGGVYMGMEKYKHAERYYRKALAVRKKPVESQNFSLTPILEDLATALVLQGKYEAAEKVYKEELAIWEAVYGPDSISAASVLERLAYVYVDLQDYERAEAFFQRALEIEERAYGPDNPQLFGAVSHLAGFFKRRRRYAEAVPLYDRLIRLCDRPQPPPCSVSLPPYLGDYAFVLRQLDRHEEAAALEARARAIREAQAQKKPPR